MRPTVVIRYLGLALLLNSVFLGISALISAAHGDEALFPLLYSAILAALFGLFPLVFVPHQRELGTNEALVVVVASWLLSCLVGTCPYILWGGDFTFTNAWFESVSGFTTTGGSILRDVEALPKGLLFWRSATHCIGGVGIIVFMVAIIPAMGAGGVVLYRAELPELARSGFLLRARRTMQALLGVYAALIVAETAALLACGMDLFDAVNHSFATVATGGFSTRNASIAAYASPGVEIVVMVFMALSGMHFALLLAAAFGNFRAVFLSSATRYYFAALGAAILATTLNVHGAVYAEWTDAVRYAAFQVLCVGTSTGFATADSAVWPALAQIILVALMLQCACAGSTSGGIKTDRIVVFLKAVWRETRLRLLPSAVITLRIDREPVKDEAVWSAVLYIALYLSVVLVGSLLLAALGVDATAAFSGSAACMGNVGPGLGSVGAVGNYFAIPDGGKWILSALMILGRLEIYGLIVFLMPSAWKYLSPSDRRR